MQRLASIVVFVALAACTKKPAEPAAGSGSAVVVRTDTGSGSAVATDTGSGSGSASGSAMGSGSAADMGSGSAVADAGSGAGSGSGEEAKSEFDKLTQEQKADFMKKNVMPPMKVAFQKFDAKKFANFTCKTCHGKDPKATKFKMPSPDLPKLDFAKLQAGKQAPKMAEFMGKVVKPDMAKILGEKEFDMAHPEAGGFGCLDCHEQKK